MCSLKIEWLWVENLILYWKCSKVQLIVLIIRSLLVRILKLKLKVHQDDENKQSQLIVDMLWSVPILPCSLLVLL